MTIDFRKSRKELIKNGYTLVPILDTSIIIELKNIINLNFPEKQEFYNKMDRKKWHKQVLNVQDLINQKGLNLQLIHSQKDLVKQIIPSNSNRLGWVDVLKLRAVRPFKKTEIPDHVPFHRETFYSSSQVVNQYNYWTPLTSSEEKSGLRIIPDTHIIKDEEIIVEKDSDHFTAVERYSAGHAIGYPYAPKIIKNLDKLAGKKEKVILVPENHSILFSAMLIHGNGMNMSDKTRFSIDTGFIPEEFITNNEPLFAAKNKPHYSLIK